MKRLLFLIPFLWAGVAWGATQQLGWQSSTGTELHVSSTSAHAFAISTNTPSGVSVLNKIYIYCRDANLQAGSSIYLTLYKDLNGYGGARFNAFVATITVPSSYAWSSNSDNLNYTLPVSTRVHVGMVSSGPNKIDMHYTSGITGINESIKSNTTTLPDPFGKNSNNDGYRYSIYLEYDDGTQATSTFVPRKKYQGAW